SSDVCSSDLDAEDRRVPGLRVPPGGGAVVLPGPPDVGDHEQRREQAGAEEQGGDDALHALLDLRPGLGVARLVVDDLDAVTTQTLAVDVEARELGVAQVDLVGPTVIVVGTHDLPAIQSVASSSEEMPTRKMATPSVDGPKRPRENTPPWSLSSLRSEERRVGKECRSRRSRQSIRNRP